MTPRPPTTRSGFSLMELLVAMVIVGAIIAVGVPMVRSMSQFGQGSAGVASVSTSVNAARIFSHRQAPEEDDFGEIVPGASYKGTAVLFTPAHEMRIIINRPLATDANGDEIHHEENDFSFSAYSDLIDAEYSRLPRNTAVAGIDIVDGNVAVIPPPFAITFGPHGNLATPFNPDDPDDFHYIYYDGDGQGYDTTANRDNVPGGYDPDDYDPRVGDPPLTDDGRFLIPFDTVETVAAVVLFDPGDFRDSAQFANNGWDGLGDWIYDQSENEVANGTPIYFSRNTGIALRGQ